MKDKLEKHGKKRNYFVIRKVIIVSSIALLLGATIAIPTTITAARSYIQQRSK